MTTTLTDTRRRLDLRVDADLAAYAHDIGFRRDCTIAEIVEDALRALRDSHMPIFETK